MAPVVKILIVAFLVIHVSPALIYAAPAASTGIAIPSATGSDPALERERFEYQKQLEERKLEVERLKAWLTGGSILLPLILGIVTLSWQTRTANKIKDREARDMFDLKDREARDMFELKAAEILFAGDNTRATKNRAKALTVLFPGRFPENFGDAFEPTQFGGPRYEAKLEVFKAASAKVQTPDEVYRIWHALYPGDQWIKPLVGEPSHKADEGGHS